MIVIYLIFGIYLAYSTFNIAYDQFKVVKMPIWVILILCFLVNIICFFAALIIKGHFGLFLILVILIPYLSIRRQYYLGRV